VRAANHKLKEARQPRSKQRPHNRKHGYAQGKLAIEDDVCEVVVGTNTFVRNGCFIRVDTSPLLCLHVGSGHTLELSVTLYDRDDNLRALIEHNEWITGDPIPWDVESAHQFETARQEVRHRSGD
jgi:hypothetical protein